MAILENITVRKVIVSKQAKTSKEYEDFITLVKQKKIPVLVVKEGDTVSLDADTQFKILHPSEKMISENPLNNNSIVGKLVYKNFSMLFTGDIEQIAEEELVQKEEAILKSTILKVGHHGSKTSSSQEFIERVKPKIALIGVGKENKFGHPNDGVIKRLEQMRL